MPQTVSLGSGTGVCVRTGALVVVVVVVVVVLVVVGTVEIVETVEIVVIGGSVMLSSDSTVKGCSQQT